MSSKEIFENCIGYNDRLTVKNELLEEVELLNRYKKSGDVNLLTENIDLLYCRLLKDNFGYKKDSYVIIEFEDDEDMEEYGVNYGVSNNHFTVIYAKNKEYADELWKNAIDNGLDNYLKNIKKDKSKKDFYHQKTIFIKKELKTIYLKCL